MKEEDLRKAGQEVRLIVCDLDGTLLNSEKLISPENINAINMAREKGIFVTICSGRIHTMLEAYSRILSVEGPLISGNGAFITDTRTGEILYSNFVDPQAAYPLLMFCKEHGLDHLLINTEACWYTEGSHRITRFEQYNQIAGKDNLSPIPLCLYGPNYQKALSGEIHKMLIAGLSPGEMDMTTEYIRTLKNLSCTSSEIGLLDVAAPGVDKGTGVAALGRILGLEKQQICVFGDYLNDIPMFEQAGFPIAMGNAAEAVKHKALAITGSNDEDGIAKAIKKYIL
ncbi:Cof-type HAD-IIB family hydrolase [Treponema primitia]|uniref:Cof-type HAD-IIB family hydrolase n=1 Tax=Treponema primitia TaxID=88058 RepID=UPI0002555021|nr:Cof-type HAD-IIB family hydrolase [Treponema primitia]